MGASHFSKSLWYSRRHSVPTTVSQIFTWFRHFGGLCFFTWFHISGGWVLGFGFRDSVFGFRVSGFRFGIWGAGFRWVLQQPLCPDQRVPDLHLKRFRGGLVFKAHGVLYHSTPGSRVIKKKKKISSPAFGFRGPHFGGLCFGIRFLGFGFRV